MAYLETEEGRRVYYEHYRGSKRPVMLIHGWATGSRVWDSTIAVLREQGHAIVSIDHRGCGQSDKDFSDFSIGAIARDAAAITRKLDLQGVVLNGWSLGGAVATAAASMLDKDCGGLVLTCGASPRYTQASDFPHGAMPADVRGMPAAMQADRAGFFRGLAETVCAKPVGKATIEWMWSIFMQSGAGVADSIFELVDLDQRETIRGLDIPILSVVGGADTFTPPAIGEYAAGIARNGTLVRIEACGHAPFIEDFQAYHDALGSFLRRLG